MGAEVKEAIRGQWRRPLPWRLGRWQGNWALFIPVPKPFVRLHNSPQRCLAPLRLQVRLGGLDLSGDLALLEMAVTGQNWVAAKAWRARWSVHLPLRGFRVIDRPQWLRHDDDWWLVVPVRR